MSKATSDWEPDERSSLLSVAGRFNDNRTDQREISIKLGKKAPQKSYLQIHQSRVANSKSRNYESLKYPTRSQSHVDLMEEAAAPQKQRFRKTEAASLNEFPKEDKLNLLKKRLLYGKHITCQNRLKHQKVLKLNDEELERINQDEIVKSDKKTSRGSDVELHFKPNHGEDIGGHFFQDQFLLVKLEKMKIRHQNDKIIVEKIRESLK